jgi:thioredoxin-like negative regulator of GroEL
VYAFAQALERCGEHDEARAELARLAGLRRDLSRVDDLTANLLGRDPDNADLHCELGVLLLRNRQETPGLEALGRALALHPDHAAAHRALRQYHERQLSPAVTPGLR